MGQSASKMFLLLTTLAAFSTSSLALPQFQPIFPLPIVGGPDSLPTWLKPNDAAPETEEDIPEVAERIDEEAVAEDSKTEDVEKSYAEYLKLCTTLGIKPISTGSSNYPGFSGNNGNTGYSGNSGFSGNTGYSGYPGNSGYTGYTGNTGYASNSGYAGNNGYTGYPSYSYPSNTGYIYYRG